MTHQSVNKSHDHRGPTDIVTSDEANPSIARQIFNGVSGTLVLLLTGIIMLVLVLWKTP